MTDRPNRDRQSPTDIGRTAYGGFRKTHQSNRPRFRSDHPAWSPSRMVSAKRVVCRLSTLNAVGIGWAIFSDPAWYLPLLKFEWVGRAEEPPVGAVKGGRSPAQRTLDGDHGTRQWSLAECRHGAAFSNGSKRLWMQNQLFEAALGIAKPWYVRGVDFDAARKVLTIGIDFVAGSRFAAPGVEGLHRVHDTQTKRLRHLNFFQHECYLEVRTPRVKLPDGRVVQIEPDWFGKLSGFTLLFEALVLALQMTFAAVARVVNE